MDLDSARALLDAGAMTGLFTRLPLLQGRPLRAAELSGLWVKPRRHFNACYRLRFDGEDGGTVFASGFVVEAARAAAIVAQAGLHRSGTADPVNCPHCTTCLVQPGLVLQLFPFDYRLPTLPACFDPGRVGRSLGPGLDFVGCQPAGYRPGMRCQIRYWTAHGTTVYGKVAVEESPGRVSSLHQRVRAALAKSLVKVRVPEPLRYIPELHLAVVAATPGESLYDAVRNGRDLGAEIRGVAGAVADFHRLEVGGVERVYDLTDEIHLIDSWVDLVAELYPELSRTLSECETLLRGTQPGAAPPRAFVHRDFYDKQVVLSSDGITLLDMDTACRGDPEIDLGNFCAQLCLRGLQWDAQKHCETLQERFLSSYPASVAADRVTWYCRSSLLRLACGYALRPRWRHLAPALIAMAMQ